MGTSKSYLPKVTKNTTRTKINITNAIKNGTENQIEGIKKVVSSFKISQGNDLFGVKNNNYVQALSTIGRVISSISSLGIGMFADQFRDKYDVEQIKTPRELFNKIIQDEEYLYELEKANILSAVGTTLDEMNILDFESLNSIDCDLFFKIFIKELIYSLFVSSYFAHVSNKTKNPKVANEFCEEVKKYIEGRLLQDDRFVVDLINNEHVMKEYVEKIIEEVLSLL